jgi:hypothetical protein
LTLMIGNCTVTPSSGCVTFAWPKLAVAADVLESLSYLLITQSHRPNKTLILYGSSSEIWSKKRGLCDHSLPALFRRLLPSLHHLEHLIFCNPTDLRQRYREFCSFFSSSKVGSAQSPIKISPRRNHEIAWVRSKISFNTYLLFLIALDSALAFVGFDRSSKY